MPASGRRVFRGIALTSQSARSTHLPRRPGKLPIQNSETQVPPAGGGRVQDLGVVHKRTAAGRAAATGTGTIAGVTNRSRVAGRWLDSADPLTLLLWRQNDVITRQQALAHLTAKAIEHKVRSGRWQRVHGGIYLCHDGPVTREQARWIGCLAAGRHAFLA